MSDYSAEFTVKTDASNSDIGAVLTQGVNPLAYFSTALGPKGQFISAYEKELLVWFQV